MKFLPTENLTFKTHLKPEEVIRRLSDNIEPEKVFRLGIFNRNETKAYEGYISGTSFNIKRITSYRNSFLPKINGIIESEYSRTTIKVKMRLHLLVIVFLCIWCGGVGIGAIVFLTEAFNKSAFNAESFIPFGMLLFVYALTMTAFKFESNKSKNDLKEIFEAEISDE